MPASPRPRGTTADRARSKMRSFASRYASKRAVAVEVVRLEIQQHRDLAGELVDILELKGRQLADDPVGGSHRRERPPDVARHCDRPPRFAEHRAEQLDGRRLAIRSGDADDPALRQQAEAELDLTPHRHAAGSSLRHEDVLAGNAGALDDELDAVQQGRIAVVAELAVGGHDVDASPGEGSRGRLARPRHPDDEHARGQRHGLRPAT